MTFTQKYLEIDFDLAQGNFQGGGNTYTASGLRVSADIEKSGGVSFGGAQLAIYGLTLSTMNQLSTFGNIITFQGRNHVTVKAGEDPSCLTVVFQGDIYNAYFAGQAQPDTPFRIEAHVGTYANAKPVEPTTQPGSQDVATLMQGIAQKAGFQFENSGVNVRIQNPYFPGTAMQQMQELAEAARIEHIVDNNTIAIWPRSGYRTGGDPTLISPQTGMVNYPIFNSMGIIVRTLFQPNLDYGKLIKVQSSITSANRTWRVYKLIYSLASMMPNGPWFQDIWASPPNQMPV